VLKPRGKCAILIGDTRQKKHVVPIGFKTIGVFLNAGFKLKELVIKRQHNCKTTGFWRDKSIKYNFLLLAHEYLPIFENPAPHVSTAKETSTPDARAVLEPPALKRIDEPETTTVWIFPEEDLDKRLNANVIERYSNGDGHLTVSFTTKSKGGVLIGKEKRRIGLLFIKSPFLDNNPSKANIESYLNSVKEAVQTRIHDINDGGFLVIQTRDVRINGYIEPLGKRMVDAIISDKLWLKEIVVVTPEQTEAMENGNLKITHQYLLVYEVGNSPQSVEA